MEQQPSETPLALFWSRTHWLLSAFLSIPPFLLSLLSLYYVAELETQKAVGMFSFAAVVISLGTIVWKWVEMKRRIGVCPNIRHSTVCRPYFDRVRQLRFSILPGFYLSCLAGICTLACVGLTLHSQTASHTDLRMVGLSLSFSPVVLYLVWELRKKEEFRPSILIFVVLISSSHLLMNLPQEWQHVEISYYMLFLTLSLCIRNLSLKQSSQDFASSTSTVCSMLTTGLLGLIWLAFYPAETGLVANWDSLLYASFAVWLYVGFVAMNYGIVHGSAAATTAMAVFAVSIGAACFEIEVPLWGRILGLIAFLFGSVGLLWKLSSPRVVQIDDEKMTQLAGEIEDADGFYVPLNEGPNSELVQ